MSNPGMTTATTDVTDDLRTYTDQDIRKACELLDQLDGDVQHAIGAIQLVVRTRELVKEQT